MPPCASLPARTPLASRRAVRGSPPFNPFRVTFVEGVFHVSVGGSPGGPLKGASQGTPTTCATRNAGSNCKVEVSIQEVKVPCICKYISLPRSFRVKSSRGRSERPTRPCPVRDWQKSVCGGVLYCLIRCGGRIGWVYPTNAKRRDSERKGFCVSFGLVVGIRDSSAAWSRGKRDRARRQGQGGGAAPAGQRLPRSGRGGTTQMNTPSLRAICRPASAIDWDVGYHPTADTEGHSQDVLGGSVAIRPRMATRN